jgi:hypothetical protein
MRLVRNRMTCESLFLLGFLQGLSFANSLQGNTKRPVVDFAKKISRGRVSKSSCGTGGGPHGPISE